MRLEFAGPGETTIGVSQPSGFASTGSDKVTLDVISPVLAVSNLSAGKDTLVPLNVGLPQGVKVEDTATPVTITSSDPSRILLSPDASTPPSASVTVSIPAGATIATYFM